VLIAANHLETRTHLHYVLERGGFYVCAEHSDAASAIEAALSREPDLCLIDVDLPGSGIVATVAIASNLPATRVVVLGGSRSDFDLFRAIDAGAVGYLPKEERLRSLPDALWRVFDGEALLSGGLTARLLEEFRLRTPRRLVDRRRRRGELLTTREWEVLELLARDCTTAEISRELSIREVTVRTHISAVVRKLCVGSRQAAVRLYRDSR
jgi:DNA-binding NarL/FixJ family response regulator